MNRLSVCLLLAAFTAGIAPAAPVTLWGLYQFENPANLGLDSSGNHNDLLTFTGATYTSSGKYGGGVALSTGYLSTSDGSVPGGFPLGNSDYTLSAWFETSTTGSEGIIGWGQYFSTGKVNALRLDGAGGIDNYWWGGGNDLTVAATTDNGVFHNVTVTFDGTTRTIYLDGSAIGSDTPPADHNVANMAFALGVTNSSEYFNGTLDNVAVFDGALDATQISTISGNDFSAFQPAAASTPEPGSILLTLAGGVFLVWRRRRAA